MTETLTLAYLAGFIDGEGTITLTKRTKSNRYRTPTLSITSTTPNILELCKDTFGGWIVTKKSYQDHHKQAWSWYVNGDKCLDAISRLLPYILEPEKHRRISLLLSDYKKVTPRNGKYTDASHKDKTEFEVAFFHPSDTITEVVGVL